ncbi:MAG: hypothetical protein WBP58_11115 [Chitinophagaceae bacterium]
MKNIIFIILIFLPCMLHAQKSWKPWGVGEAGLLFGTYELSGDLRLQGGMKKGGWLLGAGAGTDGYRLRSIPVYAQVRKMMGNKNMKPFVMGSFGLNIDKVKDLNKGMMTFDIRGNIMPMPAYQYSPGTYAELGAGLAFRTHKTFGWNLSFGYTRKTLQEEVSQNIYTGSGWEPTVNKNKYMMNRYSFRIGMQL